MKRLVILADGTWMTVRNQTNVVRLRDAVLPVARDGTRQDVYYNKGVGTGLGLDRLLGGAFGMGLSREVMRCYSDVVMHLQDGNELYLFGYSRGAYTVRSLGGLINNLGVLGREYADRIPEAYEHYRDRDPAWRPNGQQAKEFRARFSRPMPRITCIGVWDTVGSLGIPTMGPIGQRTQEHYAFHDVRLSGIVDNAFQALAIDEHRGPFSPAVWEGADTYHAGQLLEQVWFPGSHVNVGGGFGDTGLSDAALEWMADRARTCGLDIDAARLHANPRFNADLCDSRSPFYRTLDWLTGQRRIDRTIGRGPTVRDGDTYRTYEDVSPIARRRLTDFHGPPPYRPANLLAYLNRVALTPATPS